MEQIAKNKMGPLFFNMGLAHHLRTGSSIIKENRQVVVASTTTAATTVIWTAASSLPQKQFFHFKRVIILEYKHTSSFLWNCSNTIWYLHGDRMASIQMENIQRQQECNKDSMEFELLCWLKDHSQKREAHWSFLLNEVNMIDALYLQMKDFASHTWAARCTSTRQSGFHAWKEVFSACFH